MSSYETVKIERENGIGWVILNRPDKRNAMSPQMHREMVAVLDELEFDPEVKVLVLTGAGEAWCAGQDLKLFFRDLDNDPAGQVRAHTASHTWRWQKLFTYPKPTIAMVNGFCFGGGFTQLIACDFAIAAEDATFGLSEVNWGIMPAGFVSRALTEAPGLRDAVWYAMTGDTFDAREAERSRLINKAVPRERLREEVVALAERLMKLNPYALRATKQAVKTVRHMSETQALDYLGAKSLEMKALDVKDGRGRALHQFLDQKSYRPGLKPYDRTGEYSNSERSFIVIDILPASSASTSCQSGWRRITISSMVKPPEVSMVVSRFQVPPAPGGRPSSSAASTFWSPGGPHQPRRHSVYRPGDAAAQWRCWTSEEEKRVPRYGFRGRSRQSAISAQKVAVAANGRGNDGQAHRYLDHAGVTTAGYMVTALRPAGGRLKRRGVDIALATRRLSQMPDGWASAGQQRAVRDRPGVLEGSAAGVPISSTYYAALKQFGLRHAGGWPADRSLAEKP